MGPGAIVTDSGAGAYPGYVAGATTSSAGIVIYHNTGADTWHVIYDGDIANGTTTASPAAITIANLLNNPIDSGDITLV